RSHRLASSSEALDVNVMLGTAVLRLPLPDLVVMMMAPLAPRWPYNADAPGPLSTVTLSISSGFISLIPLPKSVGCTPSVGPAASPPVAVLRPLLEFNTTPSTTISASFSPVRLFSPRKITLFDPVGPPLDRTMFSPGTFPDNASSQFPEGASVNCELSILVIA